MADLDGYLVLPGPGFALCPIGSRLALSYHLTPLCCSNPYLKWEIAHSFGVAVFLEHYLERGQV